MHQKSRHRQHPPAAYLIHIGYKTQQNGGVGIAQFPIHQKSSLPKSAESF